MEKKTVDLNMFIDELESVIANNKKPENSRVTILLLDAKKYGFIKPKNIVHYDEAFNLLNKMNKITSDIKFRELCLEILKRLEFAKNLLRYKNKEQFTTRELASNAGVTHTYIVRLEKCEQSPSPEIIKKLARVLVVKPTDLYHNYSGEEEPELLPQSFQNSIARKILDELNNLNDQSLEFILKFVKDFKSFQKLNSF